MLKFNLNSLKEGTEKKLAKPGFRTKTRKGIKRKIKIIKKTKLAKSQYVQKYEIC